MNALFTPERTLIDELLAEQQRLTAVERFAKKHEDGQLPAQARYYKDLIPLSKPQPGEQYAFAVDLDACTGCKACVSACHSLNGLEEDEIWRNVGVLYGGGNGDAAPVAYQQTVTTACHHCVEPGCLEGCPVAAYEKDATTGIVRHLDDQCIGCQYCTLKCPYDVPKYSKKLSIVRKCDMCYNRLAVDEAPACVQACPNEAISIRVVPRDEMIDQAQPGVRMLPGAFDSSYTKPTTLYSTHRAIPANAAPGDAHRFRLEHPHWPLILMLLLSQLSAGLFCALAGLEGSASFDILAAPLAVTGFLVLQAGLAVSVLHLGRPLGAWRFFLGLKTSWMSREILVFSLFAACSSLTAFTGVLHLEVARNVLSRAVALDGLVEKLPMIAGATPALAAITALAGVAGVFCSAMIYVDTRRPYWSAANTFPKFFGSTLALGLASASTVSVWSPSFGRVTAGLCSVAVFASAAYVVWDVFAFRRALRNPLAPAHRSAATIAKLLCGVRRIQMAFASIALLAGGLSLFVTGTPRATGCTVFALFAFGAAVLERYCFFTAADAPRMPGGIAA